MITGSVQINKGYYFIVFNMYNEYGKRKPEWHSTGLKVDNNERKNNQIRKQAEKILNEELVRVNAENSFSNKMNTIAKNSKYSNMLFSDYMLEWLENIKPKVVQSTYIGYEQVVKGKLCPYFKSKKIKLIDLRPRDIQDFINYLYKQKLKGSTIAHYTSNMNTALKEAVIAEIIPSNPMDRIESVKKEVYIPEFYTDDELIELIEVIKTQKLELPLTLGIIYGLRREEILGLTWNAIDFKNKSITIRKTVGRGKYDGVTQFLIKDIPKNKSSYRTLPLFDFIADLLNTYKDKYAEYKNFYGNTYCNDYKDYICLMENGELMKPGYVTQTFSKVLDSNNLRHIRLHDLRHSCGTLLIQNGVPVKDIQIWLGHSNFQTTLRYAHADIENKRISASVISDKLALDIKDAKKEQITELAI